MKLNFSDEQLDNLILDIHSGIVNPKDLSEEVYYAIAEHLEKALFEGFTGKAEVKFGATDSGLLQKLKENVYMFSAAKDFQMTKEMSDALLDGDRIKTFSEFKNDAKDIFIKYNGGDTEDGFRPGWLETEYNTAIAQGQNAQRWDTIESEKDVLPLLSYHTAEDATVCDICEPLDGITLPVDDPFWDKFAPSNHFGCYCFLEQEEEGQSTEKETEQATGHAEANVPEEFQMNPGKSGEVFKAEGEGKHPYFVVPKEYKELASNNFNLPIP